MGSTMANKVLASHAGLAKVSPGDIVVTEVDSVVMSDTAFYLAADRLPSDIEKVAHPERVSILLDHGVPAPAIDTAHSHKRAREHAKRLGLRLLADVGRHGIEHQVVLERALGLPGQLLACNDTHTTGAGVLNCAARGIGLADVVYLACTGKTWYRASPAIKFVLQGRLPSGTSAKDLFLHLSRRFGSQQGHDVEYHGPGLSTLGIDERSTLAIMSTELDANFVMMPADEVLLDYLAGITGEPFTPVEPDPDAEYAAVYEVELGEVQPFVALPHRINGNVVPLHELEGQHVAVDQCFIGSCSNGKLSDLRDAAAVLAGQRVADGVRLLVTPASQAIYLEALRAGYIETLTEAGAVVTPATCGACAGGHSGVVGPGEVCITSSTRNFKGRMGSAEAEIYMASSAVVAASAVLGHIGGPLAVAGVGVA